MPLPRLKLAALPITLVLTACTSPPRAPEAGSELAPCGSFPNCVSSSDSGSAGIEAIDATPEQWASLKRWLASQPDWLVEIDKGNFLQAVAVTPTMRYRDDVQFLYDPATSSIAIRSSSRLGIGDMGANRKRVEALRELIAGF